MPDRPLLAGPFTLRASCPVAGYDTPATAVFTADMAMCRALSTPKGWAVLGDLQSAILRYLLPLTCDPALIDWWCEPIVYPPSTPAPNPG